ncbi:hydroxyacid dehydrogenase [Candidatus Micrarchaeota archaeon]|nr:hydroxyacid dehydrogenase [Candidatus Micrarchaeota archaeon]
MKIIIADEMEGEVVSEIKKLGTVEYKPQNINTAIEHADILIVRSATKVTKELLSHAKSLKLVARAGVGLDNVDSEACKEKNIKVVNTPGASTNAVAELALGLIICGLRNVQKAHHQMKKGVWDKKNLTGREIEGKTLGIIGYGRIGALLGKKAHALGMKIVAFNPPPRYQDEIVKYVETIDELFKEADVISLHAVLTDQTRNMINRENIAKMKDGVMIINAARGEMIDEEALFEACKSGKISCAALDVFSKEPYSGKLLELDNVYLTPHIGASSKEAQGRIGAELVKILQAELAKK